MTRNVRPIGACYPVVQGEDDHRRLSIFVGVQRSLRVVDQPLQQRTQRDSASVDGPANLGTGQRQALRGKGHLDRSQHAPQQCCVAFFVAGHRSVDRERNDFIAAATTIL
jgi:hypothetical protein